MVAPTASIPPRPLFGGALSATIPPSFVDVSSLRDVPDNQEVFAHAETDRSLIIELLQPLVPPSDTSLASHHFSLLAADSSAHSSHLLSTSPLPPTHAPLLLPDDPHLSLSFATGTHAVTKSHDPQPLASAVTVSLVCIRLPRVHTDLVLVFNDPLYLHPSGASARVGAVVADPHQQDAALRAGVLYDALRSLRVLDWTLFC